MTGIPNSGASYAYGDNMSFIHNTSKSESTLKKKGIAIGYHSIREPVAMGDTLTGHMRSEDNPADLFAKVVT